ncbi:MAG: efflux transporter outer membrane subunit [Prosthecobacter sp.]
MRLLVLFFFTASAFAQIGPNYERPATATPPQFKGVTWRSATPSAHLSKGEWWKVFKDSRLNGLVAAATANNQQLKGAIARFDQARAAARMSRSDFFPTASLPLAAEHQRTSENMPSAFPLNGLQYNGPSYNAPLQLGWELDLWGKLRRQVEGTRLDAAAAGDAVHNVLLGIQAEVAMNYFRLRTLDSEIRLVREAVGLRNEALKIATARVQAGAGSELEQAQAETEVASAEAEISSLQAQRDQLENLIAMLIGTSATNFRISVSPVSLSSPPSIPSGMPSDLLERRPDISQAERALHAATARIGVAKAQFFPSVKLLGRGGFLSGDIDMLFEPTSLLWSVGPSISVPLFSGNKSRWNLTKSKAAHDEALAGYRQAFIAALADVESSLAVIRNLGTQAEAQSRARASAEKAAQLAKVRYEAGTSPYLNVIDANRTTLATQRATAQIAGQRLIAAVSLIKAIGGGWDQKLPTQVPEMTPDPAARYDGDEKKGFFSKVKGWFKRD